MSKKFEQVEEIIATIHSAFPHLPQSARRFITELLPYIGFCTAIGLGIYAVTYSSPTLFVPNLFLMKAVLLLCAMVLIVSFKPLSLWMKKGWYNLFYASLIQLLLTLMFFNVYTLGAQIFVWYVLFEVKTEYS
ncbi:MAG: hypothetical protein UZ22_OP11002000848 [Microgenomates bacterium OLB23]|nr:MAG: hypothetical protein UZ22_OP11002000848 [Microgenomates bacterium OLB23]